MRPVRCHYLPELVALPLLPLLVFQGRRTRRLTPRLPEAAGQAHGVAGIALRGQALSLLALGESPVAGVGVQTYEEAMTAQLAHALAQRLDRPVHWRALGKNGVTAREALQQLVPAIPAGAVDVALIAFGVNDTTTFRSAAHWRRDLAALTDAVEARCRPKLTIVSGVPPVGLFPALPQPLRWVLGMKARSLEQVAQVLAHARPNTLFVPVAIDPNERGVMARDGYHPSAAGCAAWAQALATLAHARLAAASAPVTAPDPG